MTKMDSQEKSQIYKKTTKIYDAKNLDNFLRLICHWKLLASVKIGNSEKKREKRFYLVQKSMNYYQRRVKHRSTKKFLKNCTILGPETK